MARNQLRSKKKNFKFFLQLMSGKYPGESKCLKNSNVGSKIEPGTKHLRSIFQKIVILKNLQSPFAD